MELEKKYRNLLFYTRSRILSELAFYDKDEHLEGEGFENMANPNPYFFLEIFFPIALVISMAWKNTPSQLI